MWICENNRYIWRSLKLQTSSNSVSDIWGLGRTSLLRFFTESGSWSLQWGQNQHMVYVCEIVMVVLLCFLRWDRMESIVANKVLLIVTAADCCHGFWFWCFLLLVIAKFLLFFSVFDIFSLAIFEGGIDVVCLSTLLWVSLSMMLKNALFFSNLEDQHWKNRKKFMFTTKLNIWYA